MKKLKLLKKKKRKISLPDIVFFGLILVNFFPLKNLPKTNPPISDAKQINKVSIRKYVVFELIRSK